MYIFTEFWILILEFAKQFVVLYKNNVTSYYWPESNKHLSVQYVFYQTKNTT